jgi:GNAT superfamily N-acetyltransferase
VVGDRPDAEVPGRPSGQVVSNSADPVASGESGTVRVPANIRLGRDIDGPGIIRLIGACWSAYPSIKMDVDGEMPELHALHSYYAERGGTLWVAETTGAVTGMIAVRPINQADRGHQAVAEHQAIGDNQTTSEHQGIREHQAIRGGQAAAWESEAAWEICRVYVDPLMHGTGVAHALLDLAERHAIAAGAERLALWSDTRFDRAHRFYEKRSYVRHGPVRVLNDVSNSLEFGYDKPVDGVEALDIAGATSAESRLADILVACVDAGDAVSFLPPLSRDKARSFWHDAARDVGAGTRVLLAAWRDGVIVGTGSLDLATAENQPHRAEVQQLLVHPVVRRAGAGRQILEALERSAMAAGRFLVTVRTHAGDAGATLCRAQGWQEAGSVPDDTLDAGGTAHDTLLFWKRLRAE